MITPRDEAYEIHKMVENGELSVGKVTWFARQKTIDMGYDFYVDTMWELVDLGYYISGCGFPNKRRYWEWIENVR